MKEEKNIIKEKEMKGGGEKIDERREVTCGSHFDLKKGPLFLCQGGRRREGEERGWRGREGVRGGMRGSRRGQTGKNMKRKNLR